MSLGMKRYLGIAISQGNMAKYKEILGSVLILNLTITAIVIGIFQIPQLQLYSLLNIQEQYRFLFLALLLAMGVQMIFSEAIIASMRSRQLLLPLLLGGTFRLMILVSAFYSFRDPTMSTVFANMSFTFTVTCLYGLYIFLHTRKIKLLITIKSFILSAKIVLRAAISSWFPHSLFVLGSELGILTIVAIYGDSEGGQFYIAWTIFLCTLFVVLAITRVTHASVSSIRTSAEQKVFLLNSVSYGFIFSVPIATPLVFYSSEYLMILGRDFSRAADALTLLVLSLPLSIIAETLYYFVYGKGEHRLVLILGLVGNVPRIVLYVLLAPPLGMTGIAVAYVVGTLTQFIASLLLMKQLGIIMKKTRIVALATVPLGIGLLVWLTHVQFLVGSIIIMILSAVIYIRIHLFTEQELKGVLLAILPADKVNLLYPKLLKIMRKMT